MSIASERTDQIDQARQPTFAQLFTPKLVTVLSEGYGFADLRADAISGLTVAIVALPLSMAIAIASGADPGRGLYTAVIGGFIVSLLGGSRFQVGGPAGAFIVLVALTVERHGIDGVILATMMAGVFLIAAGYLRLGTYIKFIPYPVTVGFTAGIAVIIVASQLRDLFGITLNAREPGELIPKLEALAGGLHTVNPWAVVVTAISIGIMLVLHRFRPAWPGLLIAVAIAALATWALSLPVETIGTRFGGIPRELPWPAWPVFTLEKAQSVLHDAIAFALLGSIESLLSAVVADGLTGRRHRSNCELVAQGFANIGSALFGGICCTGLIARTATNIRAGARSPISGMLHSVFLLLFMLIAAPLASYIPLAALASVLVVVAWNMAEKHAFATLIRSSRGDATVLLATFLLTIFRDLTEGILVGFALGAVLFINRMAQMTGIEAQAPLVTADRADDSNGDRVPYDPSIVADPDVLVYRITGAFFFGAASAVGTVLDNIAATRKAYVVDFAGVPLLDSTAANAMSRVAAKARRQNIRLFITGASPAVRRALLTHGVRPPRARYRETIARAIADIKEQRENSSAVPDRLVAG
ncbi:MAG: STAS domain-containing protein [Bradyrhizobium sp.]|uniref:SulP family inorganic anion transporter n=1 Tax=Bradyrhizobium sp. TaxID=376 RepID=UPI001C287504|nr:SulP family inorganic anion transporter [Bradyrhizobium sp.]MBU6464540.1 STAS domain-containing protein [Pseudomonadota bacterium]MDE2067739.1 STAS domain-containing protein [Bradyrhizobium sp.]MDE2243438.1 STAS domain-containing protein [Bradyrhizobium sp.]MDE2468336.1 STAS domain-containing protein [Bradyrhizobium sp.]